MLLYGVYELSVQREFKSENVPIRIDMLFIGPALVGLLVLGVIAYICGLCAPRGVSAPGTAPTPPPKTVAGSSGTLIIEQADERLAHLLPKKNDGHKN